MKHSDSNESKKMILLIFLIVIFCILFIFVNRIRKDNMTTRITAKMSNHAGAGSNNNSRNAKLLGQITGSVYSYHNRELLSDTRIVVLSDDTEVSSTNTGPDGGFLLKNLKAGSYLLRAQKENYGTRYQNIVVRKNRESSIDFYLVAAAGIYGSVIYSTGEPVTDGKLEAWEFQSPNYKSKTTTDQNGQFKFGNLHPGQAYEVAVLVKNGLEFVKPVARVSSGKDTGPVEFIIDASASISGYTYNESTGKPLGEVPLELFFLDNSIHSKIQTKSGNDGYYIFEEIPNSSVKIQTKDKRFWNVGLETSVTANKSLENVNLYLKELAEINGRVVSQSGDPLPDITVDLNQNIPDWTITDGSGNFQFKTISQPNINLKFARDGSELFVTPDTIKYLFTPGETVTETFICDVIPLNISGQIEDINGMKLENASIQMNFRKSFKVQSIFLEKSNNQGMFYQDFLATGRLDKYEINVSKEGYISQKLLLGDYLQSVPDVNLYVKLDFGETITGWVRSSHDDPCEGINVKAMSEFSPKTVLSCTSDHMGAFNFDGLIPGKYSLVTWNTPNSLLGVDMVSGPELKGMAQAKFTTLTGVEAGASGVIIRQIEGRDLIVNVADKTTGDPVNNFSIICRSKTKKPPEGDFRQVDAVSALGQVIIPNLSFDDYELNVQFKRQPLAKLDINLEPADTALEVNVEIDQTFVVTGTVCRKECSEVCKYVYVKAIQPIDSNKWRPAHSDSNGVFKLSGLSEGPCFFEFNIYQGSSNIIENKTIELFKDMPPLVIEIDDELHTLQGRIVDSQTGNSVVDATIHSNAHLNEIVTDGTGTFVIKISKNATFNCLISHPDYSPVGFENLVAADILNSDTPWIIELEKGADLLGLVSDYDGRPLRFNQIELKGNASIQKTTTNSMGEFKIDNVLPDPYVLTSSRTSEIGESSYLMKDISLRDQQENPVRIDWTRGYNLSGDLFSEIDQFSDTEIHLESDRLNGQTPYRMLKVTQSDGDGHFKFTNVPAGRYRLFGSLFSRIVSVENQDLNLEIYLEGEDDIDPPE